MATLRLLGVLVLLVLHLPSTQARTEELLNRIWQTDQPYASYRQLLLRAGWRPVSVRCAGRLEAYPEVCYGTGRWASGAAQWIDPSTGARYDIGVKGCASRGDLCLMPDIRRQSSR